MVLHNAKSVLIQYLPFLRLLLSASKKNVKNAHVCVLTLSEHGDRVGQK